MNKANNIEELRTLLNLKFGQLIKDTQLSLGDLVVRIDRADIARFFNSLKSDPEFVFDLFISVTAVDWMDKKDERFEVVYHLMSLKYHYRLRIKAWVPEEDASVASLVSLWPGASFMEREVWDMYGINFIGHPDQRRILMYDEFKGHPLRKDYPVQAKQPRVALRSPEVRNTAVDMQRPNLVQIKKRDQNNQTGQTK